MLQSGGYPLSDTQQIRIMLLVSIVSRPQVLLIDSILENIPPDERWEI